MREENQVTPAPILKFNTTLIRQLSAEVIDRLILDLRLAIDTLCYTMEAIDVLLESAYCHAQRLTSVFEQAERMLIAERLLVDFGDGIVNLKRLIEMGENYISKKYCVIVSKQYDRQEY